MDSRLTFDTFVVGPANRLATAAARRAAESPGSSYNPLFVYSASGLGKSHILTAIAHHSARVHPDHRVAYQSLEGYLAELTRALEEGDAEAMKEKYAAVDVLLLDDVQFLTGQAQAQELLLRTLDALTGGGSQVVLASDRPPAEINGLDARLLSRFSGGLIVDIGVPDYETRVAIVRRKAADRDATLADGVSEAVARYPFRNVRELQGILNRILAVQELEERSVSPAEVAAILGEVSVTPPDDPGVEAGHPDDEIDIESFLEGISEEVRHRSEVPEEPWRAEFRRAAEAAEAKGLVAARVRKLLEGDHPPEGPDAVVEQFRAATERLLAIREELERIGNPWEEGAGVVLQDPDRLEEAEALLVSARERLRPFPPLSPGPLLAELVGGVPPLALRAGERLVKDASPEYSPLYILHSGGQSGIRFLEALGRTFAAAHPQSRVALVSASDFAQDFIRAISEGVAGAWRERWWSVDLLLFHETERLAVTERAQEEFFHLFETLKRREARLVMAGEQPPGALVGLEDRLRSRFEGGLVLDLRQSVGLEPEVGKAAGTAPKPAGVEPPVEAAAPDPRAEPSTAPDPDRDGRSEPAPPAPPPTGVAAPTRAAPPAPTTAGPPGAPSSPVDAEEFLATFLQEMADAGEEESAAVAAEPEVVPAVRWTPSTEKAVFRWPRLEDRLVEEA